MWAALSLAAEFDATRAEAANASSVDDKKVTPAQLPGFVFVFAQTAKGDGGVGVKPGVAADLGVRALPAVALLHGSSLADFELRELRDADVAAVKRRRFGEAEAIAEWTRDAAAAPEGSPRRTAFENRLRAVGAPGGV